MNQSHENQQQGVSRRDFLKTSGIGALSLGMGKTLLNAGTAEASQTSQTSQEGSQAATAKAPGTGPYNILFILTDQERYFQQFPRGLVLPGRERLKQMGVTFEHHYICSAVCTPSRSVIYTGQHIPQTGMFDNTNFPWQGDMSPDIPTIGDMLREAGYYTAYKGKWHLSDELYRKGREQFFTEAMEQYGFSDYNWLGDDHGHELGGYHLDTIFSSTAIHWLRATGAELKQKQQPWFLAVNLINPHDIMYYNTDGAGEHVQDNGRVLMPIAREPDHAVYQTDYDEPLPDNLFQPMTEQGRPKAHADYTQGYDVMLGAIPSNKEHWTRYRDYYFNCLKDVDRQIERLLSELDDLDFTKDTIILFTADHGEMAGAHGLRGKGSFAYEDNIHVPFIVAHPAVKGGQSCQTLSSHVDLVPTMVGMTGLDDAKKQAMTGALPGNDLAPLLNNPQGARVNDTRPGALFAYNMLSSLDGDFVQQVSDYLAAGKDPAKLGEAGLKPDLRKRGALRTIVDGRYKFSRYFSPMQHNRPETLKQMLQFNDLELFDLQEDPQEMRNLAMEPEKHAELILAMNEKLNALIDEEIGEDVGQMLPKVPEINWAVTRFDP